MPPLRIPKIGCSAGRIGGGFVVGTVPEQYLRWLREHPHMRASSLFEFVGPANSLDLYASSWLLVHYLVKGGKAGGHPLISAGVVLWVDNVLLFAIWYWLLDRGGPLPDEETDVRPDFMFTQMTDDGHQLYPEWSPNFFDYLYLSLTNASAFSPTDTLPLTRWAKLIMGVQSVASLVTVGIVLARAVNILS